MKNLASSYSTHCDLSVEGCARKTLKKWRTLLHWPPYAVALDSVCSCVDLRAHCAVALTSVRGCSSLHVLLLRHPRAVALAVAGGYCGCRVWFASAFACGCFVVRVRLLQLSCAVALASARGCLGGRVGFLFLVGDGL